MNVVKTIIIVTFLNFIATLFILGFLFWGFVRQHPFLIVGAGCGIILLVLDLYGET